MLEAIFWGSILRVSQAVIQAAPTILVGLLVAGIFRRLLGHEGTRRLFGAGTRRELPQAWLIGMILPVCSLGVIPVAREMRRAGISGGTVLAFALTAPLFNPISMLYGLTLSAPLVILSFAFATMVVVTGVGSIWDRLFPNSAVTEPEPAPVDFGYKRMLAIGFVGAREMSGATLLYILIGLSGVVLLSIVLPSNALQTTMEHSNPFAPLAMAGVALPAYSTPLVVMSQVGSMFQHANSVGAAFALLTLGAGANLGLVAWGIACYGWKRGLGWLVVLLAIVLSISYAIEYPLHPREIEPPGHTHAFDIYCRPFDADSSDLPAIVKAKIDEEVQPYERVALTALGAFVVVGAGLRLLDRRVRIEDLLERKSGGARRIDVDVPAPVLGASALLVLVGISIVGCYLYYPSPEEVFDEMRIMRGEVLTAGLSLNHKQAAQYIPIWDDWTRRLQVGAFIREGTLSPYRRMKAKIFRDRLEFLKHAIEEGDADESREYVAIVDTAYLRMRREFLDKR
ncbi:MAG: permease [Isosphaeraceae bacterium]|nr:permease [Isosphaeraceae bacterium]